MPQGVARHNFAPVRPYLTTAAGLSSATWSATNKNANVTLSGGNLTVSTSTSGLNFAGRSDSAVTSGTKTYFEVTYTASSGAAAAAIGICNASETFADGQWLGIQANGIGFYNDTHAYQNGATIATFGTFVVGDKVGVAVIGAGKLWFRINGGNWNNDVIGNQDPANNIGGLNISTLGDVFPAYNVWNAGGISDQLTANFGASFAFTPPSGFSGFP